MRKIGLDIHGVIDNDPHFFSDLSKILVTAGWEVHIMTGHLISERLKDKLQKLNIHYTHLFSIANYYIDKGADVRYDAEGRPWMDDELWNKGKAEYATEKQLDLVLDDTSAYSEYFSTSFAYCKIKDVSGKPKKQKAIKPDEFNDLSALLPVT